MQGKDPDLAKVLEAMGSEEKCLREVIDNFSIKSKTEPRNTRDISPNLLERLTDVLREGVERGIL